MAVIDPEASLKLQCELISGESLLWAGRPNPNVIFHTEDWSRFNLGNVPVFADIDDSESIYRMILDLSEKSRTRPTQAMGAFHS